MRLPPFISLLVLAFMLIGSGVVRSQDLEQIKQKALESLAKIEAYSVGIVKGPTNYRNANKGQSHLEFRDGKMWLELDMLASADAATKRRLLSAFDSMGTTAFLHTTEFDGEKVYEFNQYNLQLTIKPVDGMPSQFENCPLLPQNWLYMGGNTSQSFRKFLEMQKYETKIEQISEGRWKLSQSNLGSLLPGGNERVAIRDRYIIVDAKCDYLVTEYYGKGFQGELFGTLVWEKQGENWYAKEGKQRFGNKLHVEWTIDEISFDETKCREVFDDLERIVPFATEIVHLDGKQKQLSEGFQGGADGKAEHERRKQLRFKRERGGF